MMTYFLVVGAFLAGFLVCAMLSWNDGDEK